MALQLTPTFSAGSFNTAESASLEITQLPLQYLHPVATPTLKLLMRFSMMATLGPDKKFRGNMIHGANDAWVTGANITVPLTVKDLLSQINYDPGRVGSHAAINEEDKADYAGEGSLVDLAEVRGDAMHRSLTEALNYFLFSPFNETGDVDLDTVTNHFPGVTVSGIEASDITANRIHSLPQSIRHESTALGASGIDTRHTHGNMSTQNSRWNSHVKTYGTVTYADGVGNYRDGIPSAVASPVLVDETIITDLLDDMQIGGEYGLFAACPSKIHSEIRRQLQSQNMGSTSNLMSDLGIDEHITYKDYRTTFYVEPQMNTLWPNSMFVWDSEGMILVGSKGFFPFIWGWQTADRTNTLYTAEYIRAQLVTVDRRRLGAIHGIVGQ